MSNRTTDRDEWTGSAEAQALAGTLGAAQTAMTTLVRRCGEALGRVVGDGGMTDEERAILVEDARIATEELPEILLAMAASAMIALGSEDDHESMPTLRAIAGNDADGDAAMRVETLAEEILTIARSRRARAEAAA